MKTVVLYTVFYTDAWRLRQTHEFASPATRSQGLGQSNHRVAWPRAFILNGGNHLNVVHGQVPVIPVSLLSEKRRLVRTSYRR